MNSSILNEMPWWGPFAAIGVITLVLLVVRTFMAVIIDKFVSKQNAKVAFPLVLRPFRLNLFFWKIRDNVDPPAPKKN